MASATAQQIQADKPKESKPRKASRPNYHHIHRNLLPIEVYPLPVLIPHNPLSLVAIALSYLTQVIAPPKRPIYHGYFSSATSSIHVTDHGMIRSLWEMGFFGRGSLSRSEPTWKETQKKVMSTAEEYTGQRRNERRQLKLERAKKEQEEIAQQLAKEQNSRNAINPLRLDKHVIDIPTGPYNDNTVKTNGADLKGITDVLSTSPEDKLDGKIKGFEEWKQAVGPNGVPTPPPTTTGSEPELERPTRRLTRSKTVRFSPTIEAREFDLSSPVVSPIKQPGSTPVTEEPPVSSPAVSGSKVKENENQEHLNLSLEEAFFLSYGLGVLDIYCEDSDTTLAPTSLLSLFRRHSYHPTRSLSVAQQPDDPFLLSYAVYHHYRSLGWVVRSGVKFSVDYLLYNRGPAFSHAEFAIVVLPAYSHSYWSETYEQQRYVASKTGKSWDWLHGVNRVQAQVHKNLVLCYVEVPPPLTKAERGDGLDIEKELSRYTVRDVSVRRWTPNRTRD